MKFRIIPTLLIFSFYQLASGYALPENQARYADRCLTNILNGRYDSSIAIVDSVIAADTADPLAPVLRLAAIGVQDVDFDTLLDSGAFFRSYRLAESKIARYENRSGVSSYSLMLKGICKALHSSFYLRIQSYYSALRNGFTALDLLKESYERDSSNADALLFLGLYDYARGELKKRLWWVLFWYSGSKDRGIERLLYCEKNGRLTSHAALFGLAEIYTRENKIAEGAPLIERLGRDFPHSRFMLWERAKHFEARRLYYEASLAYDALASSYETDPRGTKSAVTTRNLQAHALVLSGQKKDAAQICRDLLSRPACRGNKVIFKDTKKLLDDL
jgi:hypothetical protein